MPFHIDAMKTIEVPMMRQTGGFGYCEEDSVQVLGLPYAGNELSMLVLLPKKTVSLRSIEELLTADRTSGTPIPLRRPNTAEKIEERRQ